jgi:hypothetical protein
MTSSPVLDPRSLRRIALLTGGVAAVIAGAVSLAAADQAREWLGFSFTGVPPRIGEAATILIDNARFVLGFGAAAFLSQLRLRRRPTWTRTGAAGLLGSVAVAVELVVLIAALFNVALVGLAVGGYGWRMIPALLPHGPFEVCAFCIAANLFLNARRRPLAGREWIVAALASLSLLTVAAVLETFAWFG